MTTRRALALSLGLLLAFTLAACAPAATPTAAPSTNPTQAAEQPQPTQPLAPTSPAPAATSAGASANTPSDIHPTVTSLPATAAPAVTAQPAATPSPLPVEARVVELEWPPRLKLGDSDSVRLALIPSAGGYTVTTEFPDNTVVTQTVQVKRPDGYELFAVARLEGVGFVIEPALEKALPLPVNEPVTWRWTVAARAEGQHRLTVNVFLRWVGVNTRETQLYSRTMTVEVTSFLGLTAGQAGWFGVVGLMLGGGLSLAGLLRWPRPPAPRPNLQLKLEPPPGLTFSADERWLLQTLFRRYTRVLIESEFRSGYSGARTLLALPILADGRADAHTIVKIGERQAMAREHHNYETFVKDTLPPMTARIQDVPVVAPAHPDAPRLAALRYTFIAEPGQRPLSLREALSQTADPALLKKLFETFGPHWWLQRRAYTFRLAQEYDRLLPAHLVLAPDSARGRLAGDVDAATIPAGLALKAGDLVQVGRFPEVETRPDGRSLALLGVAQPGEPPLRVRWLGLQPPASTRARVVAVRAGLLREFVAGADLGGRPDPLARLPDLLAEAVVGSQSTLHGDLNLENVLVGPGGFVWLIDFARTRDGHPLFDFAHLEAEIIAHLLAPQTAAPEAYLAGWSGAEPAQPLLAALHAIAARCLSNPAQPREYHLALTVACLGALKHPTLDAHARQMLYLTAAHLAQTL